MAEVRLTAKQQDAIREIHSTYSQVLQPLIAPLAKVYKLDVNPLYNETRAVFSHLARVYDSQTKSRNKEIGKAQGHLDRLMTAIVQTNGEPGDIILTATGKGLKAGKIVIKAE